MVPNLELRWSRKALAEIARIADFTSQDKPEAVKALGLSFRTKAEDLRDRPYRGRESVAGVRELILHRHYLLSYRIKPGKIEMLQVWHITERR